jgi:hypothetical protein
MKTYEVAYKTTGYGRPAAKQFSNLEDAELFYNTLGERATWLSARFDESKAFTSKNRNMIKKS